MPDKYLEGNRFLYIESKLGPNELLLESFTGTEGISQLFSFQLELLSENHRIKFEDIIGQEISFGVLGMEDHEPRRIHGIVTSFTQLPPTHRLARYRAEVSPKLWILSRVKRSKIFQNMRVPEIVQRVLAQWDISSAFEVQGTFHPREYCVQYQETDFNFISRLMEEEGIFYFFKHSQREHKIVVANKPQSHPDIPGDATVIYEEAFGGSREELRVTGWEKTQQWGSGKTVLWDHCFELPGKHLDAEKQILASVQVGRVTHKLKVAGNDHMEVYDYPGGYAKRYDCGDGSTVSKIFEDNERAAEVNMQLLEMSQFRIRGSGYAHTMTPGFKFTLERHFNADGQYVLTSVTHSAREGGFHAESSDAQDHYANDFQCIPLALPYRPARVSTKTRVAGCQTATVVEGAETTDQYARIKVMFHWDRDSGNSCWARVGSFWAGSNWGAIHIPRVGQEVIVDFLEGDPDRPIVVGSVYNADNMPPYDLPSEKTRSGIKSQTMGGSGYNEICWDDKAGAEEIRIHAQRDMNTVVENDRTTEVKMNCKTTVDVNMDLKVGANRKEEITGNDERKVTGKASATIMGSESRDVTGGRTTNITGPEKLTVTGPVEISAVAPVKITAPMVTISAAMVQVSGVVQCTSLIASVGVVSPSYTPGVGNIW